MNRTAQITFPEKDYAMLERFITGMGWGLNIQPVSSCHDEKRQVAEEFARKISLTTDDYKDLENQNFCMKERPQTLRFSSIEDEIAYYDSLEEEDFLSEEDSAKYMELWKSV